MISFSVILSQPIRLHYTPPQYFFKGFFHIPKRFSTLKKTGGKALFSAFLPVSIKLYCLSIYFFRYFLIALQ